MQEKWHIKSISAVFDILNTNQEGLSEKEVISRIGIYGQNKLPDSKPDSFFIVFIRQFKSSLIYVLLVASLIVFIIGEHEDAFIILFVLFFNAVIGSIQEGRAQNTLFALKKYATSKAVVLRDSQEEIIADYNIVPGDIILLQEGERVCADARIILSNSLKIDESALTGESLPVNKISETVEREFAQTSDQKNMVFKGTHVLTGSGKAVVVATGTNTTIGKIAKQILSADSEIPLEKNIKHLSRAIIITVAFLNLVLLFSGLILGKSLREMFTTLVSLSVSIIPEGLPIVTTFILATGVWRMSKRNALVKRLQAVESLGQAEIIAVDKTGTITKNEMVVQKLFVSGNLFEISGTGYELHGEIRLNNKVIEPLDHRDLIFATESAALCTGARIAFLEKENRWVANGDPTEASLLVLAKKIGAHKDILEQDFKLIAELPFDYKLKYRASLRENKNKNTLIVLGAPESILNISSKVWKNGKAFDFLPKEKEELVKIFENMSEQGLRVVALAVENNFSHKAIPEKINKLTFVGFFGMKDALRSEVPYAMAQAQMAGVRVIMITGDHKITAKAIAKEAGIFKEGDAIITGEELEKMTDSELMQKINNVSIFSRVSPEHKLRIIKAFKESKKVIAMTGDGVNDAPSLVYADLGVSMGNIGTEVAREASDIVLLDDNFGSIVSAIEEGRSIYRNIKNIILYLFSTSLGEVLIIAGAIFLKLPIPILPSHIIWLNFITDPFLGLAMASEPKEKNLLLEKLRKPNKYLLDATMIQRIFVMAPVMMIGTLFIFKLNFGIDMAKAQTMALTVLAIFQWFNAYNCRSENKSIFSKDFFANKFLFLATAIVIILQLLAVYSPFMQKILRTVPLSFVDWLLAIAIALSIVIIEELRKIIIKKRK